MKGKNLSERDKRYLWHPLTQHKTAAPPLGIVRAEGALLWDEAGNSYIDGIASWYTAMYGHGNKFITEAINKQMKKLDFVMFSGFTHEPAIDLAEKLMAILPDNQSKLFFNDNGSTAIEAAIKIALQYHHNHNDRRDTLIAFENGFHGDTFGAMSASGLSSYNGPFEDFLLKVERIPVPNDQNIDEVLEKLESILKNNRCAAFIFEPLVQGAAGMKFHSAKGLDKLVKKCREHNVLCIADEVMTGFGKTGKNFASENLQNLPDVMCLSKALTAGMFPLSITSCSQNVFDAFLSEEVSKGFFHSHTYSAHPIGCAAALAGLELLNSKEIMERRTYIEAAHKFFVLSVRNHPKIKHTRAMGVILAIDLDLEIERYGNLRDQLYQFFMNRGIMLRPLGNTIYVLPPFVISNDQLREIYNAINELLESF
ncbi:adenosylmethionine--8-amino-7-oxononanoate transaminase [Maribacter cobaltidurans]|uniref:Adenosylmethionine-8-amino-7-oxononanoate aminotransferase n=1 Tax=Maribacter cobaltidurans TaxID=1178778 RepID=A0A223V634_9FLAO|nr:adenosylmethionine--8-amino-7-oxononanoate transaminase [Maribacter cobaltidurans]ASV30458.1 adenosylmethionine--8-amino-7-oxononanoate transaminase [Maribacter cobaltidurans]GGD78847.1 adenosylmethionine--8-amino-7-oxononanoate aminotransferase BioA [Maribacter cobaltidurans]